MSYGLHLLIKFLCVNNYLIYVIREPAAIGKFIISPQQLPCRVIEKHHTNPGMLTVFSKLIWFQDLSRRMVHGWTGRFKHMFRCKFQHPVSSNPTCPGTTIL